MTAEDRHAQEIDDLVKELELDRKSEGVRLLLTHLSKLQHQTSERLEVLGERNQTLELENQVLQNQLQTCVDTVPSPSLSDLPSGPHCADRVSCIASSWNSRGARCSN